jgi:hypothetical protein
MIVHPDFLDHWKTKKFTEMIADPTAPQLILRLWAHCQRQRTSSFELSDQRLKDMCHFAGEGSVLREALKSCGFIRERPRKPTGYETGNPDEPTGFIVHDWERVNANMVAAWNNGAKGGRPSKLDNPRISSEKTRRNPLLSNRNKSTDKNKSGFLTHGFSEPEQKPNQENIKKFGQQLAELTRKLKVKDHGTGTEAIES